MRKFGFSILMVVALVLLCDASLGWEAAPSDESESAAAAGGSVLAITGARVFDGTTVLPRATVLIEGGQILAVGSDVEVPAGARTVAAAGKTLLPGFIDSHVHAFGDALVRSALFGTTTVLDMFTSPDFARVRRDEQAAGNAGHRADLYSAGYLATAPGGHGTQYGMPVPTLTSPAQAEEWVRARVEEGSDYIKIILEDGSQYGAEIPTLDNDILRALVTAAHAHGKLAVAHVSTAQRARDAVSAGADGLVHLFLDQVADDAWVKQAAEAGLFVIPTLTVLEGTQGTASGVSLIDDPRLAEFLLPPEITNLRQTFPARDRGKTSLDNAFRSLVKLKAAGVPILAGTDAPNPGTWYGVSMHREVELLVEAGLTPIEALQAATSRPADAFGLDDRGRIAPGKRADLILVDGDPTQDIRATRAIHTVWKQGEPIERLDAKAQQRAATGRDIELAAQGPGVISDFEDGAASARYGAGWQTSTDSMMGGKSSVEMAVVTDGETGQALRVTGELAEGFPFPWAGAMFFPGASPMVPVDLSATSELRFRARSAGMATLRVMFFAQSLGRMPGEKRVEVGPEWREIRIPFADVPGLDAAGMSGLLFSGGPGLGEFSFLLDDIELR